ncbi:MAG: FliA/WhiG family RNA polymerase sigma factor [Thermodesulfobacteriota bacterium]
MLYQPTAYDQRDELIKDHLDYVDFIVHRMRPQIPGHVSLDDLKSAAMYGLMDAASRFDPEKGVLFKTFAETRIRGAVLDELRKMDWFSRSMRDKHNRVFREIKRLEQELGRDPTEEEIAEAMGMDLNAYQQILNEIGHLGVISLNEALDDFAGGETFLDQLNDINGQNPEESTETQELVRDLAGALDRLPEKERLVITLFYYEEFTQKEIADVLDLSEGRISQLHSQALLKLRAKMPN